MTGEPGTQAQQAIAQVKAQMRERLEAENMIYDARHGVSSLIASCDGFSSVEGNRYWFKDGSYLFYSDLLCAYILGVS